MLPFPKLVHEIEGHIHKNALGFVRKSRKPFENLPAASYRRSDVLGKPLLYECVRDAGPKPSRNLRPRCSVGLEVVPYARSPYAHGVSVWSGPDPFIDSNLGPQGRIIFKLVKIHKLFPPGWRGSALLPLGPLRLQNMQLLYLRLQFRNLGRKPHSITR